MTSREMILERLKTKAPHSYSRKKVATVEVSPGSVELFAEKATAAGAQVYVVNGMEAAQAQLEEILAAVSGDIIYSTEALLQELSLATIAKKNKRKATEGAIESTANYKMEVMASAIGITSCDYGLAETGSVIIKHQKNNERLISLAPETHICILKAEQILANRFMLAKILEEETKLPSAYSIITGVSRTADVALQVVLGMHGPKQVFLIVIQKGEA